MTYSNDESAGAKAFTWAMIAGAALLLVEVTWPQAMVPAPAAKAVVETVTVAHPDRVARAE